LVIILPLFYAPVTKAVSGCSVRQKQDPTVPIFLPPTNVNPAEGDSQSKFDPVSSERPVLLPWRCQRRRAATTMGDNLIFVTVPPRCRRGRPAPSMSVGGHDIESGRASGGVSFVDRSGFEASARNGPRGSCRRPELARAWPVRSHRERAGLSSFRYRRACRPRANGRNP
jgi:hypothetical protein